MTRTRIAWLALVALALGLSVAYGLRDTAPPTEVAADLRPLQAKAALAPCPTGLSGALPDATLACLGGGPAVPLRGAPSGRPTMVNVYGSWCGPCYDEMPLLKAVHASVADRVDLVGLDSLDDPEKALEFAIDVGQTWAALVDEDGLVSRQYGGGAPKMIFLDPTGRVVQVVRTSYRTEAALRADITRYLGVTA